MITMYSKKRALHSVCSTGAQPCDLQISKAKPSGGYHGTTSTESHFPGAAIHQGSSHALQCSMQSHQ
ncbi:hypothetical protein ROHU_015498 [Labeo rohita]|uniref:Uncharacterized protein n=1 Tax=Labeo rohita TaxID=84645 RepID=A0A498NNT8_LABRO|nr:hypothetical protein ROHU_015498 [Labeo rohita]